MLFFFYLQAGSVRLTRQDYVDAEGPALVIFRGSAMASVQTAQHRNGADEKKMTTAKKLFLAGVFFSIGVFAAVVQLHPSHPSAETPDSMKEGNDAAGTSSYRTSLLPANSIKNGESKLDSKLPAFPDSAAPYFDKGTGKYVQAYPQPILLTDEKVISDASVKDTAAAKTNAEVKKPVQTAYSIQTANQAKKPEPVKPVQITPAEFKPLHQFAPDSPPALPNDKPAEIVKVEPKESPKPVSKGNDDLLPMFDFAENLAPAKLKKETVMPENPFPAVPFSATPIPAATALEEKSPVQSEQRTSPPSMQPFLFQKLRPLVEAEHESKPATKANTEVKPNETPLLRLVPLAELLQGRIYW
ncbi:MAG: hypothetical protein FWE67_03420 [Planctomycetaceae bacterium]|nr:hypothetical protein [Planctomycetaceae bacterium]